MRVSATLVAFAATCAAVFPASASADITSVSGGAFGESVDVTPLGAGHITSGPLPVVTLPSTGGGPFTNSALSVTVPTDGSILTTGALAVSTQGSIGPSGSVDSSAAVANVNALQGRLTATAISSECHASGTEATGSTTIVGGSLDGQSLAANPQPNTKLTVNGLTVILNEQTRTTTPGDRSTITVNAVHIILSDPLGSGDIIISQSRCGVFGPNVVVPIAPAGIVGTTAILGAAFFLVDRRRRRNRGDAPPAAAA